MIQPVFLSALIGPCRVGELSRDKLTRWNLKMYCIKTDSQTVTIEGISGKHLESCSKHLPLLPAEGFSSFDTVTILTIIKQY